MVTAIQPDKKTIGRMDDQIEYSDGEICLWVRAIPFEILMGDVEENFVVPSRHFYFWFPSIPSGSQME